MKMENKTTNSEINLGFLEVTVTSLMNIMPSSDTVIFIETPEGKYTLDKSNIRIVKTSEQSEIIFHINN
jgi:hypothetical protein